MNTTGMRDMEGHRQEKSIGLCSESHVNTIVYEDFAQNMAGLSYCV